MGCFSVYCVLTGTTHFRDDGTEFVQELMEERRGSSVYENWRSANWKRPRSEEYNKYPLATSASGCNSEVTNDMDLELGSYSGVEPMDIDDDGNEEKHEERFPTNDVLDGLVFSQADVDASQDYIVIDNNPSSNDESARLIFDVVPTDSDGFYTVRGDPDTEYIVYGSGEEGSLITFTAYCILKTAAPSFDTQTFHRSYRVTKIIPITADPIRVNVCGGEDPALLWMKILCNKRKGREDILYEAWRGQGRLWTFVRPDVFPIAEAVVASKKGLSVKSLAPQDSTTMPNRGLLPLETLLEIAGYLPIKGLLCFMSLNRAIRAILLPHADNISYKVLHTMERYFLPSNSIETPDGTRQREDLNKWEQGWVHALTTTDRGYKGKGRGQEAFKMDRLRHEAPWLMYRIECSRSCSMTNRRRIWGIAEQMESLAKEQGILV
ncbi:hypothetical protein FA15DRAFT_760009 [Coprinopsis marcescibilis]|uniref:F-box domain-containing protein n=1 Tax=Coprinopsis marcescibilis TaxID=230819 RepID=A0A5C3KHW8_COPMA|nr:hypothetical protein FA15DRAFT_760009 [Coprinopsis marcescibilis]